MVLGNFKRLIASFVNKSVQDVEFAVGFPELRPPRDDLSVVVVGVASVIPGTRVVPLLFAFRFFLLPGHARRTRRHCDVRLDERHGVRLIQSGREERRNCLVS